MCVKCFIHCWISSPLPSLGNLICYSPVQNLMVAISFFFWLGVKGTVTFALLHRWECRTALCRAVLSSPHWMQVDVELSSLPHTDEPWTPVHVLLFPVEPLRHRDARNLQKFPMAHEARGCRADLSVFTPPSSSPFSQALKWQSEVGTVSITLGNRVFFFFFPLPYMLNNFQWGHSKGKSLGCTLNIDQTVVHLLILKQRWAVCALGKIR